MQIKIYKLQKQIYYNSLENNIKNVWKYQNRLIRLFSAKLLATRRVTQDNRGKNTAGVDNVKTVPPFLRIKFARSLVLDKSADKIQTFLFSKKGVKIPFPVTISTFKDRAKQALALMALEPQWEALFQPNRYGFRPGRSCHDAIQAIYKTIVRKEKYVVYADITNIFKRINHQSLLHKINTFPLMRGQIKSWLNKGILFSVERVFPKEGSVQGTVLSPLLANIALHGMENLLKKWVRNLPIKDKKGSSISGSNKEKSLTLVRYADNFVIIHHDLKVCVEGTKIVENWLLLMGLKYSGEKKSIKHTFISYQKLAPGFDFLGFNIRQYPVGCYHRGKTLLFFKTLIKPSKISVKGHLLQVKRELKKNNKIIPVLSNLNRICRRWAYYYRTVVSSELFSKIEKIIMVMLIKWCRKKGRTRNGEWIYHNYLRTIGNRKRFGYQKSDKWKSLFLHSDVKISRHTKVYKNKSPYDGDWAYWTLRGQRMFSHTTQFKKLLKEQRGRCLWCDLYFTSTDLVETDHIIPRRKGGKTLSVNLQLLHAHCHDQKTVEDLE